MSIKIRKRNGRLDDLDITKIQVQTIEAIEGLDNVSQSELEIDAKIQFIDGMESKEIASILVQTAVQKIDIDRPHWTFVASRLFLFDLYHQVRNKHGIITHAKNPYFHIMDYIKYNQDIETIIPGLEFGYDMTKLNDAIKPERDYQFNYLGVKSCYDKYLIKDVKGDPTELPQHMFMAIAMFLAKNEEDQTSKAIEFYNVISTFEVMLATPTLSNARRPHSQMSSCYIGAAPDQIEGIFGSYGEMATLSKYGGGIGWDWHDIRSQGSDIDGYKAASGGTIPFLKITNDVAIAVDQRGCVSKDSYVDVLKDVKILQNNEEKIISMRNSLFDISKVCKKQTFNEYQIAKEIIEITNFKYSIYTKEELINMYKIYISYSSSTKKNSKNILKEIYPNLTKDNIKNISKKFSNILKGSDYIPIGYKIIKYKDDCKDYICNLYGDVRNRKTLKPLYQSKENKNSEYLNVSINNTKIHVARLIYFTFSNSINFHKDIDHIDNNKWNNNFNNLQELTHLENSNLMRKESDSLHILNKSKITNHLKYGKKLNGKQSKIKNNYFEIKEYIYEKVLISNIKVNDFVKSFNINLHKIEPELVQQTHIVTVEKEDQIQLNYEDGGYTITSLWHPSLVYRNNKFIYIRADEVLSGDIGIDENNNKVKYLKSNSPDISSDYRDLSVRNNENYFCTSKEKNNLSHVIHNTRKGAIAVYLEPWHMDIYDFIDLKKNSGEERRRAHDLFPALWIPDLFMQRVKEDGEWTLFDPYQTKDLHETHSVKFEKLYEKYEKDEFITKKVVRAKDLWKKILTSYFESGSPFLCFKDSFNRNNPNQGNGIIRSSNLCTEIAQNTRPDIYKIQFHLEDEDGFVLDLKSKIFEEYEQVEYKFHRDSDETFTKRASKISTNDLIKVNDTFYKVYFQDKVKKDGSTAVCNLASVNLSKIHTKEDLARVVPVAVRMLDNVIDLNYYPVLKAKKENLKTRAIGLGVMGEAQMLAENKIYFGSDEHLTKINEVMENFSFETIKASVALAKEKGTPYDYDNSEWFKGIFPFESSRGNSRGLYDLLSSKKLLTFNREWEDLREEMMTHGVRNIHLMSIAPTSSISILVGTTQAIEPVYKRKWFEENLSGQIPVTAPNLNTETYQYYTPAYEVEQLDLIKVAAVRQSWIDQAQSLNIFMSLQKASGKYLNQIYMLAHDLGCKSTYYLRGQSPEAVEDVQDRSIECSGCQ